MSDSDDPHRAKVFEYEFNGQTRAMGRSFYRGDGANYMPRRPDMAKPGAIAQYILSGWMPAEPFIGPDANIVAFGSCFAANIGRYLANIGFDVATEREGKAYVQRISDGLVNVFAIAQQFEWAWENRVPDIELWHGWKAEDYGYDEEVRLATKKLFDEADVFILTFGLSEIWYDEPTGEVFWRAVPEDRFDPARHKFRIATYEETLDRLRHIYALIRQHRPDAAVVFTLSPIGLAATFRPVPAFSANSVSKAILRAAIDVVWREVHDSDPHFFYFPAYEVVLHGFREPFTPDLRHPHVHVINANMKAFERYFCTTGLTDADLEATIGEALDFDSRFLLATTEEYRELASQQSLEWRMTPHTSSDVSKELLREKRDEERNARRREREEQRLARKRPPRE